MKSEAEIRAKADWVRGQIQALKDMLNNRNFNKYDENIYEVIYHFSDELNLLKWVLNEDQPEQRAGDNQSS